MKNDYNIRSIKKEFSEKGIYYTPEGLAKKMMEYIAIDAVSEVYDPTSGDGALLSFFSDDVKKYGQEINENQLEYAKSVLKNFTGVCGDTLKNPAFLDKKFDCIFGNPPFSVTWEPPVSGLFGDARFCAPKMPPKSKADYAFILHILHYLSETGVAVVLNFPGILYRGGAEYEIRKWIVEKNYIERIVRIPGKTFVDTQIETALIIFKKNKTTTNIIFEDLALGKEAEVSFNDIEKNDFCLSVSQYVFEDEVKEFIDPVALMTAARTQMLKKLKNEFDFELEVCKLEHVDPTPFFEDVSRLALEYIDLVKKSKDPEPNTN